MKKLYIGGVDSEIAKHSCNCERFDVDCSSQCLDDFRENIGNFSTEDGRRDIRAS